MRRQTRSSVPSKTVRGVQAAAAGAVLVTLAACGSSSSTAADTTAPAAKSSPAAKATKTISCKDKALLNQVVQVSKDNAGSGDVKVLSVYKPTTVSDRQAAYQAGKLKPVKGKNMVTVLTCNGVAAGNDSQEYPIRYHLEYDTNGAAFVSLEDRKS